MKGLHLQSSNLLENTNNFILNLADKVTALIESCGISDVVRYLFIRLPPAVTTHVTINQSF